MKNKFIVIEGCDFTGKSTVIEKLVKTLERMKARVETNSYDPKSAEEVEEIRNAYFQLSQRENTALIDTTNLTVEGAVEMIIGLIQFLLKL